MKSNDKDPPAPRTTMHQKLKFQRERKASWKKIRKRTRRDRRFIRIVRPIFYRRNLYLLLLLIADIVMLAKGLSYGATGKSAVIAVLCILGFCLLAMMYRAAWRKERDDSR